MKNKKVICPKCKRVVRQRLLRKDGGCKKCWRESHRRELMDELGILPRQKITKVKLILPNAFDFEKQLEANKKRIHKLIKPINKIEKRALWLQLRDEGMDDQQIYERIKNLEENVKKNHLKVKQIDSN